MVNLMVRRMDLYSPPCFQFTITLIIKNMWSMNSEIAYAAAAKSLLSCPTLCDPIDGSPLGSSVPGTLQARILEWVAISFSLKH